MVSPVFNDFVIMLNSGHQTVDSSEQVRVQSLHHTQIILGALNALLHFAVVALESRETF